MSNDFHVCMYVRMYVCVPWRRQAIIDKCNWLAVGQVLLLETEAPQTQLRILLLVDERQVTAIKLTSC